MISVFRLFFFLWKNPFFAPECQRGQRPVRFVAVRVGHRRSPEIVGGHADQRAGAQHVCVHGHRRYVVVNEIAAQPVPVAHGHGDGHGRVHGDRSVRPPPILLAAAPGGAATVVLVILWRMLLVIIVIIVMRAPHRTAIISLR